MAEAAKLMTTCTPALRSVCFRNDLSKNADSRIGNTYSNVFTIVIKNPKDLNIIMLEIDDTDKAKSTDRRLLNLLKLLLSFTIPSAGR